MAGLNGALSGDAGPFLIGIDLGTSGLKTVLIDQHGTVRAQASQSYRIDTPQPGWAEQDPQAWVNAALGTVRLAVQQAGIRAGQVAAIGLAGQMHSTVCVDAEGQPLRPAILWADQRSQAEVNAVVAHLGAAQLSAWTGNPLATGFMLATWLWLRAHEAQTAQRTRWLLLPKDYLRYSLTGALGSEPSDASSTLLFDPYRQEWSRDLLHALQIAPELLPPLHPSAAMAGGLTPICAQRCELLAGTPVVFGGSDQAMQAVGNGVLAPGQVSVTIGTGGQWFAPLAHPLADPQARVHLFCHALPHTWHLEAAILSAGLCLQWLRDQVFAAGSFQTMADAAARVPPGAEGLLFFPYLSGERTPYMDPTLRGGWIGLSLRHGQAHLTRAVMEGVVFAMRQGLDLILELGAPLDRLIASGGSTHHPLWLQLEADIFNRPIWRSAQGEMAAMGAALLAGVGAGIYPDVPAACQATLREPLQPVWPDPQRAAAYARCYGDYVHLASLLPRHPSLSLSE